MKKLIPLLTLCAAISAPISAFAACSTPTADAGTTFYNTTVNAVQFCNGDDWYNTGLIVPSATGTTCTTPAGPEGSAFYNTTQNTVQFCNGDNWVNMGTMRFPSATGTTCTVPTGPEGSMFFNTTTKTMQFCNGDDWVNATYLTVAANAFNQSAKLVASDPKINDGLGQSVSINGDYAIVGAYGESTGGAYTGAAYIFKRTGSIWAQEAKIMASDRAANDQFGYSVSMDSDYAIVGAVYETTGGGSSGAAYIFKRTGTSWGQQAKIVSNNPGINHNFGSSVSISGDYAIVGARYAGSSNAGLAYVYKRTNTNWAFTQQLQASDTQNTDFFGAATSLDGDYAIVGAYGEDTRGSSSGAAYIFKRTGVSWAQEAKVMASDAEENDYFGFSVSINGDYAIVGASGEDTGASNAGAAYIFKRTGTSWAQEAKLTASDGSADDGFGIAVSISGDYAVATANKADTSGADAGAAYIFKRTGAGWNEESKIVASDGETLDYFGRSIAVSNGTVIVGSGGEDTGGSNAGAAYIFD